MNYFRVFFLLLFLSYKSIDAQTISNNGAYITAQSGAFIAVNGSIKNDNSGIITINGNGLSSNAEVVVSQNVINNATINANGFIRLFGDWLDNNTYSSTTGTVFLEGANQILGGTASTIFNNLTMGGSGVKTHTINKYVNGILDLKHLQLNTDIYGLYVNNTSSSAIIRTSGFVSSANGGFLSRKTLNNEMYLFPVGSTANTSANIPGSGTLRYRPVQITPNNALANTYTVRMANVNASSESYDLNLTAVDFCELNSSFYHQINRSFGTSSADIVINFDVINDGNWEGLARWNITTPNLWEKIPNSSVTSGIPLSSATKLAWTNFNYSPYILYNNKPIVNVSCNDICTNQSTDITATISPLGSYSHVWNTPIPNPGNVASFNSAIEGNYCIVVTNTLTNCMSDPSCCSFETLQQPIIIGISPP